MNISQSIREQVRQSLEIKKSILDDSQLLSLIETVALECLETYRRKGKILLAGNGGSAADAQHIAAEFINRFQMERRPLAAFSLTTDTSVLTSIANDYSFDEIFSKQIRALGRANDVAVGISTSGNSKNVIKAVHTAKAIGIHTIGLTGRGGTLSEIAELVFAVQSDITARIQETHMTIGHILCDLVERLLFENMTKPKNAGKIVL